jgi:hypothetical protein
MLENNRSVLSRNSSKVGVVGLTKDGLDRLTIEQGKHVISLDSGPVARLVSCSFYKIK